MAGGRLRQGLTMALCAVLLFAGCREDPTLKAYRQGVQALKRGHYDQSIRLLNKSIELGGTNVPEALIYNSLGLAYSRIGQQGNALGAFGRSVRLDPKLSEPIYNTGVMLAESGRDTQAAACFEKAAQLDSADTRALEYLSWLYRRNQRWDDARKALNDAHHRAPREPRVLTAMALLELRADNVSRAISFLQEALEHDARYTPAIYNLAMVNHLWLKNDSQAVPLLKDYLRLAPKGENATNVLQVLQDINKAAGESAVAAPPPELEESTSPVAGQAGKEKSASFPAAAKVPAIPASRSCEELLRVARKLAQQDRNEAAINNYLLAAREAERVGKPSIRDQAAREANELCAQNARAHYEVGLYWSERGQQDEALPHLKQAANLSNTWYEAHMALARVAMDKSEFDTAVVSLKQADENCPDRPEALWMLANLYDRNLGLPSQAIQSYEQFNQRFGGDERVQEGRMRLKALRGGMEENVSPSVPAKTKAQTSWQWLFKSRSQEQPEN
ncbi:MAG: tetratricopeptide repeat protein [Kiritimatiellae bacterium]|nr:tetratricopeptide repeat protein [Kiritimatiellia bacterium]